MKPIIVIKVGTSTLLDSAETPSVVFEQVASSIATVSAEYRVVLVTSGAIGFGVAQTGLAERPTEVADLQALAMIGQVGLLRRWREALEGTSIGQVLVTRSDLEHEAQRESFTRSLKRLWDYDALPIVNENDAVSSEEITFGDNDQLAAQIAVALGAQKLVLLTDQDGIQENFGTDNQARLEMVSIHDIENHIAPVQSKFGKGGASSKVLAAHQALKGGVEVYIAHAVLPRAIEQSLSGKLGTKVVQ